MPLLDNLWSVVKGGVAGGLLQDDSDLLNTYIPQQFQQGMSDQEKQQYAQKIRSIGAAGLLSRGVDSQERTRAIQQNVLGDLLQKQQQAQQVQEQSAVSDYMSKLMQPTVTPEMAISASGQAGPTQAKAAMIGAANPLAVGDANKARAMAYRQLATQFDISNPAKAEQYRKAADMIDPKPEAYTLSEGQVRYVGDKPVASVAPKMPDDSSSIKDYKFAVQQGYQGTFEQFKREMASAGAPKVAVNTGDPTALAKAGLEFQDRVRSAFKADEVIAGQFGVMQNAVKNPSAQGDTALLYSFFKVLDPESTVREGELNLVMESRSIPDKLKGYAQRLATGQTLTPAERQDLLNQAGRQVQARIERAEKERKAYIENARRLTLDPDIYVPDPYAVFKGGAKPAAGGQPQRMRFNPATGRLE